MLFGYNVGNTRYPVMADDALGDMNDRIQSRDIPRVYQPFSV